MYSKTKKLKFVRILVTGEKEGANTIDLTPDLSKLYFQKKVSILNFKHSIK